MHIIQLTFYTPARQCVYPSIGMPLPFQYLSFYDAIQIFMYPIHRSRRERQQPLNTMTFCLQLSAKVLNEIEKCTTHVHGIFVYFIQFGIV